MIHRILSLFITLFLLLSSCGRNPHDRGETPVGVPAALTVCDKRVVDGTLGIGAGATIEYVDVRTNVSDWIASVEAGGEWLKAEPYRDPEVPATGVEVVQKLKLAAGKNDATEERNATVRINGAGIECTLVIVQSAAGYVLAFDSPVYASAAGEDIDVAVTANVAYGLAIPGDCGWLEEITASTEGLAPNVHRLRMKANTGSGSRSVFVEVAATDVPGLTKTLVVEQQGAEPAIEIDGTGEVTAAWDEPFIVLKVTANVTYRTAFEYEKPVAADWIWRVQARSLTERNEKFVLGTNLGSEPRVVTVRFLSDDPAASPALTREVKVTQEGYTPPTEDIFELMTPAANIIGYAARDLTVEIRTGRDAGDIAVAGLPGWMTSIGEPLRSDDVLVYRFKVGQNAWPLVRSATLTFTAGTDVLTVSVRQDDNPLALRLVEYASLAGLGDAALLCDYDLGTYVLGGQSQKLPQEWRFGMKKPSANAFNRLIYYPIVESPEYGISEYELLAYLDEHDTYHSVCAGVVPASFYSGGESMRNGFNIDFPTVENARRLILRVKSTQGGSNVFGASEVHLVYDRAQDVPFAPILDILTSSPITAGHSAVSATMEVAANIPYRVEITEEGGGAAEWIRRYIPATEPACLGFTIDANPGGERSAVVTLVSTMPGVAIRRSITITQGACDVQLGLASPASGVVSLAAVAAEGGWQRFDVELATSLAKDDIAVGALPGWLELDSRVDAGEGVVRFGFSAEDNTGSARTWSVVFSGRGRSVTLTVSQAAGPDVVPTLAILSPDPPEVVFGATPYPDTFEVVLSTNMAPGGIVLGVLPSWLTAEAGVHGDGTVTYKFTIEANAGEARSAAVAFSVAGQPEVSVMVRQAKPEAAGKRVVPVRAICYDFNMNQSDVSETVDGDKATWHAASAAGVWGYEYNFPNGTDLVALVYYPRDSDTDHGTFRQVEIEVVCHEGGVPVEPFRMDVPPSVCASADGRRAGWRINLPNRAVRVSHLRIRPVSGYQNKYAIAEVEFFAPE